MKPRHAVALALVGWYLMIPPDTPGGFRRYEYKGPGIGLVPVIPEPINEWQVVDGFDSAADCHAALEEDAKKEHPKYGYGKCIETASDPRLKGN